MLTADEFMDLFRERYRGLNKVVGANNFSVVTRKMVANHFDIPLENVRLKDGCYEITLPEIKCWSCTLREVPVD